VIFLTIFPQNTTRAKRRKTRQISGCGNEHIVIETEKTAVRYERFYSSFFTGLFGVGTIPF